jgi:CBS domain-containing protein
MCDESVGAVIVTSASGDEPLVVGIVTDRDIVRAQLGRVADLSRIQAGDIMSDNPLILSADDSIENGILHLRARRVRRAPVVAANGTLIGMVSTDDLLGHVAEQLTALAHLVSHQRHLERARTR